MGTKQAKLALENDPQFVRSYKAIQNRQTGAEGKNGSSASVQRRACIGSTLNRLSVYGAAKMIETLELECYFNEKWNLCPYGLRTRDEMEALSEVRYRQEVHITATPMGNDQLDAPINQFQQTQETEMTQTANDVPAIETKIFIFGTDASTMSDDQIVDRIFDIERQIETLQSVKNKPKKLVAKLNAMQDDIKALVEYVDSRA